MGSREKMHTGELYDPMDGECTREHDKCMELLRAYNDTQPGEQKKRDALLREMFAEVGEGCIVETPIRANWGGHFVHLGNHVYINFELGMVDDTHIYIGNDVMIGPRVMLSVACHPKEPSLRRKGLQYNKPIVIKDNVWIGADAVILAGVTIGENSVIGAGSVVTKDIPANVVAVGNPCRVIEEIGG